MVPLEKMLHASPTPRIDKLKVRDLRVGVVAGEISQRPCKDCPSGYTPHPSCLGQKRSLHVGS